MELSLTTIVKNEQANIREMLESVFQLDYVKEVVIGVDNETNDLTADLISSFCRERGLLYTIVNFDFSNFSQARNHVLDYVNTEYVLVVDGDEIVEKGSMQALKNSILPYEQSGKELDFITAIMIGNDTETLSLVSSPTMRIFKSNIRYIYRAHEYPDVADDASGLFIPQFRIQNIKHKRDSVSHPARIALILQDIKETDAPMQKFNLASEYLAMSKYEDALKWLDEFIKNPVSTTNYIAHIKKARCHHFLKQYKEETELLRDMLYMFPHRSEHIVQLGLNAYMRDDLFQALNFLTVASNISKPNTPEMGFDHYYTWVPWIILHSIYKKIGWQKGIDETRTVVEERFPEAIKRLGMEYGKS